MNDWMNEARRRYDSSVEIRDSLPSPEEVLSRKSFLERAVQSIGGQEWMWKTTKGKILAVIVLPAGVFSVADFWANGIQTAFEYAQPYIGLLDQLDLPTRPNFVFFSDSKIDGFPLPPGEQRKAALIAPRVRLPEPTLSGISNVHELSLWRISRLAEFATGDRFPYTNPRSNELAAKEHLEFVLRSTNQHPGSNTRWYSSEFSTGVLYATDDPLIALDEIIRYQGAAHSIDASMHQDRYLVYEIIVSGTIERAPAFGPSPNTDWAASQAFGNAWIESKRTDMLSMGSDLGGDRGMYLINANLMADRIQIGSAIQI